MKVDDLITLLLRVKVDHGNIPVFMPGDAADKNGPATVKRVRSVDVNDFFSFDDDTLCVDQWSSDLKIKTVILGGQE